MLLKRYFIPVAFACLSAVPSWSAYGDQMTVRDDSPLPPGWVAIGYSGGGQMGMAPAHPKMTILDINGAPVGTKVSVLEGSPIPSGWVILGCQEGMSGCLMGSAEMNKKSMKIVIQCIVDNKGTVQNQ